MNNHPASEPVSMLVITGTMGAGKSAVLGEASDLLKARAIQHAAIDVDGLGLAFLSPPATNDDVMSANFASVCANFASHGVRRFLLARAVETREELERYRAATAAQQAAVCRLIAPVETLRRRVTERETGLFQSAYVARVEELNSILDRAHLEDFTLVNGNRPLTDVALEMLVRAGWIRHCDPLPGPHPPSR